VKILLSAYACEPNKGSEPEVGWSWAVELANLGHDVWILTRTNNQDKIESVLLELPERKNLHFIYYDLPQCILKLKKLTHGVRFYYFFWQFFSFLYVRNIHAIELFDKVHHVTFVSIRQPSFLGWLGIPFIFGPVAGGEQAPWRLRMSYGVRGFFLDLIRDLMNFFVKLDPFMWMTFIQADEIYVTSEQTKNLLPRMFHKKTMVQLAIGHNSKSPEPLKKKITNTSFNILYVGRSLYWKGMHLGIAAFAELVKKVPNACLTMISDGPDKNSLEKLAIKLNVYSNIVWIDRVEQNILNKYYSENDVFLFPSLHDSGGMVVLEAMAHSLPVVCLELGGPSVMTSNRSGVVISVYKKSESDIICKLTEALLLLYKNTELRDELGRQALNAVSNYQWKSLVKNIYN